MKLITWNIQWARGIDAAVNTARIVRTANKLADFDVLCLQEVAVNFTGLEGSQGEDQVSEMAAALPGYTAHYGAATDVDDGKGGRSLFGNVIFSRLPVMQVYRHLLPRPADPGTPSMQRIAVEAIVAAPWGAVRIITTHLEYYSSMQRLAQIHALRSLHAEACSHAAHADAAQKSRGPFQPRPRPAAAILTGDFNCPPGSAEYQLVAQRVAAGCPSFIDAWTIARPTERHEATAGLFENSWAKQPLCCDFVFVTEDLATRVRNVAVDTVTQASDHQPVLVEFSRQALR